jgi:type IV secretion system protein VirB9
MKKILAILVCFICTITLAYANQNPRGLSTDRRMKIVAYNANDIVTIHGSHFVSTAVYLDKREVILHVDIGDPLAWKATPSKDAPYIIFVEPQLPQSDTNMTVITSKRSYQFRLITNAGDTARSQNVIFSLQFRYPEEEKSQFESEISQLQRTFLGNMANDAVSWNYDYSFYGSKRIAPIQAVDNGTFTIFKFPKNTAVPAIFAVDGHRNESLVNFRVEGDYVFIQGIHRQYTFRNGEEVTSVYNDNMIRN